MFPLFSNRPELRKRLLVGMSAPRYTDSGAASLFIGWTTCLQRLEISESGRVQLGQRPAGSWLTQYANYSTVPVHRSVLDA